MSTPPRVSIPPDIQIKHRVHQTLIRQKRKRGKIFRNFLSCEVRMARLELAQENSHYPLKVARLPFRHIRLNWDCKGTAKF